LSTCEIAPGVVPLESGIVTPPEGIEESEKVGPETQLVFAPRKSPPQAEAVVMLQDVTLQHAPVAAVKELATTV
jgi:hypothetical protein